MKPPSNRPNPNFQKSKPLELLEQFSNSQANGYLKIIHDKVTWVIYFNRGTIVYATHSLDPFERLERYLRRLSSKCPNLTAEVRNQARLNFEQEGDFSDYPSPDYQAICWLVEQDKITKEAAAILIKKLIHEVLHTYLLLTEFTHEFVTNTSQIPLFFQLNTAKLLEECYQELQAWKNLSPTINSPYQRPYFFNQSQAQKVSTEVQQKLSKILKGFSFCQLATLLNQDEIKIAQNLHQLIINGAVILREPQPPFDLLPKIVIAPSSVASSKTSLPGSKISNPNKISNPGNNIVQSPGFADLNLASSEKNYKIACVDDSPTILNEINRFLDNENLQVFPINNSAKALMTIVRINPDLILLDVGMPAIDGYQLCSMLRRHNLFKTTPIVMVTGNTGLIDRAKAKVAGATDYMTKPFTQEQLIKMVFRYLT